MENEINYERAYDMAIQFIKDKGLYEEYVHIR